MLAYILLRSIFFVIFFFCLCKSHLCLIFLSQCVVKQIFMFYVAVIKKYPHGIFFPLFIYFFFLFWLPK